MTDDLYVVKIQWDKDHTSPLCGPIAGITRTRKLMTVIRKRLRANRHRFLRVDCERVNSIWWLFSVDALADPVDRLLASIGETTEAYLDAMMLEGQ